MVPRKKSGLNRNLQNIMKIPAGEKRNLAFANFVDRIHGHTRYFKNRDEIIAAGKKLGLLYKKQK